jgi:hypothetical protein
MLEDIDYSEEFKESKIIDSKKLDWIACAIVNTAPPFDIIYNKLKKINIKITEKDYKKVCKDMGFKN